MNIKVIIILSISFAIFDDEGRKFSRINNKKKIEDKDR
jgi:hypothetical protein